MHPVLFEIAGVSVTAYGLALGVSFVVGIALAMRRAPARGIDPDVVLECGAVALFSSLLGSRLLFALESPELAFSGPEGSWLELLSPSPLSGAKGLSMSLGVLLAVGAVLAWLRVRGQPLLAAADVMAPSVLLGEAITRIGCFMNGCCHGVACTWPWGVHFPPGSLAAQRLGDVAVHPTQLYTAIAALGGFVALLALDRRKPRAGTVFFAFLAGWSIGRLLIDTLRFYPPGVFVEPGLGLSVAKHQPIVVVLAAIGVAGLFWLARRSRDDGDAGTA